MGRRELVSLHALLTNTQYDDRVNLRRLTLGDFHADFRLVGLGPAGRLSFTKMYSMIRIIQYPTAGSRPKSHFLDRAGARRRQPRRTAPGSARTGGHHQHSRRHRRAECLGDHSRSLRPRTGVAAPFLSADERRTGGGLRIQLQPGFLRRNYGVDSNDYGPLAAAAFHRYAFTDQTTLGLRGQATDSLYNIGPFGTYQSPLGIIGGGVSVGGQDGHSGVAAAAAYSYTGQNVSLNLGAQYLERQYAQLSDLTGGIHARTNQYASGSVYSAGSGVTRRIRH
jgi:hypothetical protein